VLDKKRDIAVLKAMGATDGALLRSFVYQGTLIGVVGTVLGLGLGLLICKGLLAYGVPLDPKVYFISRVPVLVRASDFALVGLFAMAVCRIATAWPARHAARLRPAGAFREQNQLCAFASQGPPSRRSFPLPRTPPSQPAPNPHPNPHPHP